MKSCIVSFILLGIAITSFNLLLADNNILDSDIYAEFKEEQDALSNGEEIHLRESLEKFARSIDELYQKVDELDVQMAID